ncbi:Z1 domain-containing protein [Streptomyces sp. NPDC059010]|uniref:Z1 domain-containing protein n=1 Tax=Streptomyces sp. NPDC059010 TaxID=3346695 RepID=UPI00369DC053
MNKDIDALYETFRLVLELSQATARLEQFSLEPAEIDELCERHARRAARDEHQAPVPAQSYPGHTTWYAGPREGDVYWPALLRQLGGAAFANEALTGLDDASSRIVANLQHPKEPSFSARGLVLTYPQSGAITNIAAVISKAADRGYRLFIVLAGIHNVFREQVHQRLTRQLVQPHPDRWVELTTSQQEYTSPLNALPSLGSGMPMLCVVKKNATVLGKLARWLAQASSLLHEYPALIIDVDADLPSVASTNINPRVGDMLHILPRSAYLAYTSSPLTSLLLEPGATDLFPKDFIVALPRPPHYTGTEILFGHGTSEHDDPEQDDDGYDMIRLIPDQDISDLRPAAREAVTDFNPSLPATLRQAVEYFWMVAAARTVRGSGTRHNTMLIHASNNATVQASFLAPLKALRDDMAERLASPDYLAYLRRSWQQEIQRVPAADFGQQPVDFDELIVYLPTVLQHCQILTNNSSTDTHFENSFYPATIVVGGGTPLTRGLFLEGLSVGYFVTTSSAYDTLQQMEHWFGFRAGYGDLPRIWMPEQLSAWWREIADTQIELRQQLERAAIENISPLNLAVQIRSHPKLRTVTAAKRHQSPSSVSYGAKRVQTHYFHTNASWLRSNLEAARSLVATAADQATHTEARPELGRYLFRNVPSDAVINFLATYQFHEQSAETDPSLLIDYIRKRITVADSLRQWNVAIIGKPATHPGETLTFAENITVGRIIRSRLNVASQQPDFADIKTLMGARDAAIDLAGDINNLNEQTMRAARRQQLPHTGLLALYPIDKTSAPASAKTHRAPLNAEEHVIGVGLVFPHPTTTDSTV